MERSRGGRATPHPDAPAAAPPSTTPPTGNPERAAARTERRMTRSRRRRRSGSCRSCFEPAQLVVDELLELGVELFGGRLVDVDAPPAPAPGGYADHDRTGEEPGDRQNPGEQIEPLRVRLREHAAAVVVDEPLLDLALRVAGDDPLRDQRLHLQGDRRVRLVERRVASRADQLALELVLRRVAF